MIVLELDDREVFIGSVKFVIFLEDIFICFYDMSFVYFFNESKKINL